MAPPRIKIEWDKVALMCEFHCTCKEIAAKLGISHDTLQRACKREKDTTFAEFYEQHQGDGKVSLRRAQWELAMGRDGEPLKDKNGEVVTDDKHRIQWVVHPIFPNPALQIFLGKNYLGQADKHDLELKDVTLKVVYDDAPKF